MINTHRKKTKHAFSFEIYASKFDRVEMQWEDYDSINLEAQTLCSVIYLGRPILFLNAS